MPNFVQIASTVVEISQFFQFYKMAAAAISDFRNLKLLTVRMVKRVKLHHCAKFRRNCLNCSRDIAIFRFLKMAAAILDFYNLKFLMFERSRESNCVTMPNFVKIAPTETKIWRFFDFSRWRPPPSWILET